MFILKFISKITRKSTVKTQVSLLLLPLENYI